MTFIKKIKDEWQNNNIVKAEIMRRLYQNSQASHAASFILAILLGLAVIETSAIRSPAYVWLAMITVTYVTRDLLTIYYKRKQTTIEPIVWLNRFRIATILSGLVWASSSILLFEPENQLNQSIILFTLTGICAAAISIYAIDYFVLFGFLMPIMLAIFLRLYIDGSYTSITMSLMIMLFVLFIIAVSRKTNQEYVKNIIMANQAIQGERREKAYSHIMELIANSNPIEKILDEIVRNLETLQPSMKCSILLLSQDGKHLQSVSAKSLPDFYNDAINGEAIGLDIGSCGAAAFTGNRVIAEDITTHPNWVNYRELAAAANLRSCWSEPIKDSAGNILGTFAIYHHHPATPNERDIQTISQNASLAGIAIELARNAQEQRLASLFFQNTNDVMLITDNNSIIVGVNPAFTEDTGFSADEVLGKNTKVLRGDEHDDAFYDNILYELSTSGKWQGEVSNKRKDGSQQITWVRASTIYDDHGNTLNRVFISTDITKRKQNEELIWKQANYDELTGLPNRRMFLDRFEQEIKKSRRANLPLALLFIDLDEFKEVNDALGHHVGDILLKETAQRLTDCIRESDTVAQWSSIARLGGDEFTIILSELNNIHAVEIVAKRILEAISKPYQLNDELAYVSASIGITIYPDDSNKIETLLRNADQAMYAAKREGKNRFNYFTKSMQANLEKRIRLTKDLHFALDNHQFYLVYQPIVNLRNNKILKAEALIRWEHPTNGLVSPADFIPIAENTGLIHEIGSWVFIEAVEQVLKWRSSIDPDFQVSINKSPVQFYKNTKEEINSHLNWPNYFKKHQIPGDCIAVEITEGLLLDSNENVYQHLLEFRDAGIQVALDDFGTGYSSLSYLKKFDIDYIKIDQSFVQNLEHDSDSMVLCQAIIVMAHKLKLKVIAEGIETQKQLDLLKFAGCDFGQGYFFSKPLKPEEFEELLD